MRIAVVGSRRFPALHLVETYVRTCSLGTVIVSGGAVGVDLLAQTTAKDAGLEVAEHAPEPGSGIPGLFARNTRIVEDADYVVAFQARCSCRDAAKCKNAGWSHGTTDTLEKARLAGKLGWVYRVDRDGRAHTVPGHAYRV